MKNNLKFLYFGVVIVSIVVGLLIGHHNLERQTKPATLPENVRATQIVQQQLKTGHAVKVIVLKGKYKNEAAFINKNGGTLMTTQFAKKSPATYFIKGKLWYIRDQNTLIWSKMTAKQVQKKLPLAYKFQQTGSKVTAKLLVEQYPKRVYKTDTANSYVTDKALPSWSAALSRWPIIDQRIQVDAGVFTMQNPLDAFSFSGHFKYITEHLQKRYLICKINSKNYLASDPANYNDANNSQGGDGHELLAIKAPTKLQMKQAKLRHK